MDAGSLRESSTLASWRVRLREIFWAHTDFKIKKLEGQYVDDSKEPGADSLEVVVLLLLVLNMIVLGIYDPLTPNDVRSVVAQWMDLALSILFTMEAALRFAAFGLSIFLSDKWNLIDVLIVVLSLVASIVEASGISFGSFTILRTVRVFRPLRSVTTLPAAKTLVVSIYSAIKSLEDVTVLYVLFVVSFSIMGVTQFMGRLKTRCVRDEFADNFTSPFNDTRVAFAAKYPFTQNYTISDFVCGGNFEKNAGFVPSQGCNMDETCNDAQFIGNRILTGYTCPWGYSCSAVGNPMFGYNSFDSVPQAMLTIFVCVTGEGLYRIAYETMDAFDVTAAYFFVAIHILGSFFIINLSVVLVTVTFEHVSAKIRNNKPKLVSKMAASLAAGPRVFRKGGGDDRSANNKEGGNGKFLVRNDAGVVIGEVGEEYAYLVPDISDPSKRLASLADVTRKLMTSETFADHISTRYEEELRKEKEKEEADRKEREEAEKKLAAAGEDKKRSKKKVNFLDKIGLGNVAAIEQVDAKTTLFADKEAELKFVKDREEALKKEKEEEEERERNMSGCRRLMRIVLTQDNFESLLNVIIIINIAIMCTYHYGSTQFLVDFFNFSNIIFACLFAAEFLIKVTHFGLKNYFVVPINVFDFIVLLLAIVDVTASSNFPSVSAFRAIRLLKVMKSFPGILRWTVVILVSIKSSFLLLITIFVVNYCFAMFGLHMFGGSFCNLATSYDFRPDNTVSWCPNRPRANFDDVVTAMLSAFQLMTGDNWDMIMYNAMRSKSWVVSLAFVGYVILMTFVLVNILVGILLSGPSQLEVDLIGQKLFGISFSDVEKKKIEEQKKKDAEQGRGDAVGTLAEWEEHLRNAQRGMSAARLDLMAFAEKTVTSMPRKFLDSLEAVEDTIMTSEHAAGVANSRRSVQRWFRDVLTSRLFENFMLLLLSVSSLALAFETPESAPDDAGATILRILDIVFSIVFLIEIFLNFYAFGMAKGPDSYLQRDPWNVLDTILVFTNILGTITYFVFNTRWLKILLVVRAVRPLRFVKRSQGLRTVFTAFAMSAVPLKNVIFLAIVLWTCWGLMGVQLFMGTFYECTNTTFTTRQDCQGAGYNTTWTDANNTVHVSWVSYGHTWQNADLHFDHLGAAFLSLLTLASMDGGADVMTNGIDAVAIDRAPQVNYSQAVSLYFVSFIFIGGYFLVNLVVSVIIDTYNREKIKNGDTGVFLTASQNSFLRSHRRLLHGVPQIFYDDANVSDLKRKMRKIVSTEWFRNVATLVSLINGCLLMVDFYDAPTALRTSILIFNTIFAVVFAAEVAVKMISLSPKRFFHSRFNQFDVFVTLCVFTGVIGEAGFPNRGFTFIFRAMRSISLFRVVRNAEKLRHVIGRFSYSLYGLANVGALLFIFLYIFGVMGVKSFGLVKYQTFLTRQSNFNNVFRAILLLLNALAGGGWTDAMSDCSVDVPHCDPQINNCGVFGWSQAYFVIFLIFTKFVLLNMFIAVILDSFVSTDFETISISRRHVQEFFENWTYLDPQMTLRIESRQLVPFLRSLSPDNPLGFGGSELTRKIGHEFRFIQQLRLHEMNNTIELQDLISALCDATLGVELPDSEIKNLQKYADRKFHRKERDLYIGKKASGNSRRVVERFAVHVIENYWRDFKMNLGKKRGKLGSQSLTRSHVGVTGEQDFMTRRDNLSYVDDSMTMWGERDSDEEREDGDDGIEYDEVTGVRKPKTTLDASKGEKTVIDSRPALRKYLFDLANPLIKIADKNKTKKLLQDVAQVKALDVEIDEKEKEDAPELLHLLIDHERNKWFEEEQARINLTLKNKEPFGGRLVHAERVIEDYRYRQQVAELKDAERAFVDAGLNSQIKASSSSNNDVTPPTAYVYFSDYNKVISLEPEQLKAKQALIEYQKKNANANNISSDGDRRKNPESFGEKMLREKGLLSQTKLWKRDDTAANHEKSDYLSPVSNYYASKLHPEAKIPGTFAAAGFSVATNNTTTKKRELPSQLEREMIDMEEVKRARNDRKFNNNNKTRNNNNNGNDDDDDDDYYSNNNNNSRSGSSFVVSVPSVSFDNKNNSDQERTTFSEFSSPFLFRRPTAPVPPAASFPTSKFSNEEEEMEQDLLNMIHNQNRSGTATSTNRNAILNSNSNINNRSFGNNNNTNNTSFGSAAANAAIASVTMTQQQQRQPQHQRNNNNAIDTLETQILLQELREWKSGEQPTDSNRVTRPGDYNKTFSANEYASL